MNDIFAENQYYYDFLLQNCHFFGMHILKTITLVPGLSPGVPEDKGEPDDDAGAARPSGQRSPRHFRFPRFWQSIQETI
jgi:hypothetical protein